MLLPILSLIQILLYSPGFWTHSWSAFWSLRTCSGLLAMSTSIMISRNSSSPASHSCWTSSPPENCKMSIFRQKNKKKCQVRGRCDVSFLWPHPLGICIPVLSDTKHNYLYWKTINFTLKGALPLFAAARRIVKNALEIWQIYKMWLPTWAKGETWDRGLTNDRQRLAQNFNDQNYDDNCSESVHKECFTKMRLHLSWPDVWTIFVPRET